MDVIKAAIKLGPNAKEALAISLDGTSHTYAHLLGYALSIATKIESIISTQKSQVCASFLTRQRLDQFI